MPEKTYKVGDEVLLTYRGKAARGVIRFVQTEYYIYMPTRGYCTTKRASGLQPAPPEQQGELAMDGKDRPQ